MFGVKSLLNSIWICKAMLAEPLTELLAANRALERDRQEFIDFVKSPVEYFDDVAPEVITAFEGCFKLPFPYEGRIRFVDRKTIDSYNKASDSNEYAGRYFSSGNILILRGQAAYYTINNIFHEIGHDIHAALSKDYADKPKILGETFADYVQLSLETHLPFFPIADSKYSDEIYIKAQKNAYQLYEQQAHFADTLTSLAMCQTESDLEWLLVGGFNPTREEKLTHLKNVAEQNKQFLNVGGGLIYSIAGVLSANLLISPAPFTAIITAGAVGLLGKRYANFKNTTKNHIAIASQVRDSLANSIIVRIAAPCQSVL